MNYPLFKVFVSCMTFNHSKYIVDAMNSFVMQRTNFPFVCCVVDDCSTDGEQDVIRDYLNKNFELGDCKVAYNKHTEYAEITFAQHKLNHNCYFAVVLLKENHYSQKKDKTEYLKEWYNNVKYVAICEGDDYWIDETKLQIQSDLLDNNLSVDMCSHGTICQKNGKEVMKMAPSLSDRILTAEETIKGGGGFLGTNSLMYRVNLYKNKMRFRKFLTFDYTLQISGSLRGGIYYLAKDMSVYRMAVENSWCQRMTKNPDASLNHQYRMMTMLQLLDDDTNGRFHNVIYDTINGLSSNLLMAGFKSEMFKKQYNMINTKYKLYIVYKAFMALFGL